MEILTLISVATSIIFGVGWFLSKLEYKELMRDKKSNDDWGLERDEMFKELRCAVEEKGFVIENTRYPKYKLIKKK